MTKRLTIALVAVALFVLLAVLPVSAAPVNQGAPIFIGASGLNVADALCTAQGQPIGTIPAVKTIGWWPSGKNVGTTLPDKTIDLTLTYTNMGTSQFVGYNGNWNLVNPVTGFALGTPVFFVVGNPGTAIYQKATVFIGEGGLLVTPALNQAQGQAIGSIPVLTTIGWWASAADIGRTSPTRTIDLGVGTTPRYQNMQIAPADFVGYTGVWYLIAANGVTPVDVVLQ